MTEEVTGLLRRAREEKGLSFEEAEEKTHVPAYYLQILEGEGDPRILAETLYLIPFLRTYATFLGLDPAVTIAQFIRAMQQGDTPVTPPPARSRRLFARTVMVLLMVIAFAVLSLWWFTSQQG